MYFQSEWNLIRWLNQKPANLVLHCFHEFSRTRVHKNVACGFDLVMTSDIPKFSADAILYGEIQVSKKDI